MARCEHVEDTCTVHSETYGYTKARTAPQRQGKAFQACVTNLKQSETRSVRPPGGLRQVGSVRQQCVEPRFSTIWPPTISHTRESDLSGHSEMTQLKLAISLVSLGPTRRRTYQSTPRVMLNTIRRSAEQLAPMSVSDRSRGWKDRS